MCAFSTSADQGILSQLPSTSMMRMNAPVESQKGDQAIRRTGIILLLDFVSEFQNEQFNFIQASFTYYMIATC